MGLGEWGVGVSLGGGVSFWGGEKARGKVVS